MSMAMPEKITCPKCGKEFEFTMWSSFNADVSKGWLDKFLSGEIFRFTCPHCGEVTNILYPMLYHDMHNKLMISYGARSGEKYQEEALEASDLFLSMGYKYRMVEEVEDLLEKALIFQEGFDDRTIEILKCVTLGNILHEHPDANIKDAKFFKDEDGYHFIFRGDLTLMANPTKDKIDEAHTAFSHFYKDGKDGDYIVNQEWAENILRLFTSEEPKLKQ